mgnify:CR=1 FL=1|uniref:Uncharacterized protein n=1 Tax=viral metagenome TaxID=1070528 RepID=A0A6C0KBK6_9ZZZZ
MDLNISKFNPRVIEERRVTKGPPTCIFIGKRGSGKSTLVADILYYSRKIPMGLVISATEEGNHFYQQHVPEIFIHGDYQPSLIEGVISRQKKALRENKENSDVFVLLDDCMYDKKMIRDKNIRGMFMNGRHWRTLFLLTTQYCMDLPPDLRANLDFIFVLRENIIQNQEKLYKNFFGLFATFDAFKDVMNACTEGYDCLVLDNTSRSNKIEDCIFWYSAKPDRKFKIGHPDIWKYNTKYLNDEFSPPTMQNKKKTSIKVHKTKRKKKTDDKDTKKTDDATKKTDDNKATKKTEKAPPKKK